MAIIKAVSPPMTSPQVARLLLLVMAVARLPYRPLITS